MVGQLACHETAVGLNAIPPDQKLVFLFLRITHAAGPQTVLSCLDELLQSRNPEIRQSACRMLGALAVQKTIAVAILRSVIYCSRLVSLLHDTNMGVIESAAETLRDITESADSLPANMDAEILDYWAKSNTRVHIHRRSDNIHQRTIGLAILGVPHWEKLMSLLRYHISCIWAVFILAAISEYPDGVRAIAKTGILAYLPELMDDPDREARRIRNTSYNRKSSSGGSSMNLDDCSNNGIGIDLSNPALR
ncbi:hypothetical protein C8R44DRAFT_236512 [Mycena epipterygia]|nr:hypothetical protein C8R44DRAFT_236512 [Mycena epipterygia]